MQQKPKTASSIKITIAMLIVQRILPELAMRITKVKAGAEAVMNFSEDYLLTKLNPAQR